MQTPYPQQPPRPRTGNAQRYALDTRIRAIRRRIIGGSLVGTAAFTLLAGYQTLSKAPVAAKADSAAAIVQDVAPPTEGPSLFTGQGAVTVTAPTASAATATTTIAPTPTASARLVAGGSSASSSSSSSSVPARSSSRRGKSSSS